MSTLLTVTNCVHICWFRIWLLLQNVLALWHVCELHFWKWSYITWSSANDLHESHRMRLFQCAINQFMIKQTALWSSFATQMRHSINRYPTTGFDRQSKSEKRLISRWTISPKLSNPWKHDCANILTANPLCNHKTFLLLKLIIQRSKFLKCFPCNFQVLRILKLHLDYLLRNSW